MYSETIGKLHFWVTFIGVNLCSSRTLPRPVGHAAPLCRLSGCVRGLELVSSYGSYISGFGVLIFIYGVVDAFAKKRSAEANPWGAGATTLEWTLPSPPPFHQFEVLPRVQ